MSGFSLQKIAMFFPKKRKNTTGMSICESSAATDTSPKHIRNLTNAGMFTGGGADTPALCGTQVSWDTKPVESLFSLERIQSHSHPSYRLCQKCLHEARQALGG